MNFRSFFDFFTELSSKFAHPKCLLICLNCRKESGGLFKSILQYAWSKKFLDFSIIDVSEETDESFLHYMNPFYDVIMRQNFTKDVIIFPDKLQDGNGYPLRLPFYNFPKFLPASLTYEIDENGAITNIGGPFYRLLCVAIKKINMAPHFPVIVANTYSTGQRISSVKNSLLNDTVNMNAATFTTGVIEGSDEILLLEIQHNATDVVILVPKLFSKKLNIPPNIVIYLIIMPLTVAGLSYIVNHLKLVTEAWEIFSVFQVLFGIPVSKQPKMITDRILFSCIILLSMAYSIDFYSEMLDLNIVDQEVPFDSFEMIDKSGLEPFIHKLHLRSTVMSEDEYLQNILKKAGPIQFDETCVDIIRKMELLLVL